MNSNGFRRSGWMWLAVCAIGATLPAIAQDHAHYSRPELRKMMKEAATGDQYRSLATWFREEETVLRGKARMENAEFEKYKDAMVLGKYPTRVDTARSLRDYYSYRANRMATLATRYETELARLDPAYRPVAAEANAVAEARTSNAQPQLSGNERMLLDRIEQLERQTGRPENQ